MSQKVKALNQLDRLNHQLNEVLHRIYQVDESLLYRRLTADSWTVIQVLEHLYETEQLNLQYMQYKVNQNGSFPKVKLPAKLKYVAMRVAYALPIKFKAPKILSQPNENQSFNEMQEKFADLRKEVQYFMEKQDDSFFELAVCKHPVVGRISLLKMLQFYQVHLAHHEKQILRVLMRL